MKKYSFTILAALLSALVVINITCKKDDDDNDSNKAPTCQLTAPTNGQQIEAGQSVTISADATDSDGTIEEVRFFINGVGKSTVSSFPYNYKWNTTGEPVGNHTLKATAIDNNGSQTSDEISVELTQGSGGNTPVADFTANPTSGTAPLTVNFSDQSINTPTSWLWDFGDGNSSTEQNPEHIYQDADDYTVSLTVSNEYGSDTETKTDFIIVTSGGGNGCEGITEITYGGQTYNTVEIGNQCWLAENLNYQAGNSWCYDNDPANCETYGRLYDWETALTVCPGGWHLPSDDEWKILEGTVDSQYPVGDPEWDDIGYRGLDAGKNLKSTSGWNYNGNGADLYGFGALPGGYRYSDGSFYYLGSSGTWWSSSENSGSDAWYRGLNFIYDGSYRSSYDKTDGFSVRCLKD